MAIVVVDASGYVVSRQALQEEAPELSRIVETREKLEESLESSLEESVEDSREDA